MKLVIQNDEQLNDWMNARRDHHLVSIKGVAPSGATYSDGEAIILPINVSWHDLATGETFAIVYEE